MKITDVEPVVLSVPIERPIAAPISIPHPDRLASVVFREYRTALVRITTDEGLTGVGECMVRLAPKAYADIIDYIKPVLLGQDPRDVERLWDLMYGIMMNRGHQKGFYIEAISGIDIALWDILGQSVGLPIYRLLGGRTHERLWAYASSLRFREVSVLREDVARYREQGFKAMKIKIGQDPSQYRRDIRLVETIREMAGDDVVLMVDANCGYDLPTAVKVGRALEALDIRWFEEPLPPDWLEGYRELKRSISIPLAHGESECTRFGFRRHFVESTMDVVQPSACRVGGISEAKKIVAMAQAFHLPYAPHTGSSSVISMTVALHLAMAASNFYIYEYMMSDWSKDQRNPLRWELAQLPARLQDGYLEVEDRPGLGIQLNEEVVRRYRVA